MKRLHKNATFRKENGKKLFDAFHHYYTELTKISQYLTTEILRSLLLLTLLENGNKYTRSKKLRSMTLLFKKKILNVFYFLLFVENLKKIYLADFELQVAK